MKIKLMKKIMGSNLKIAEENRCRFEAQLIVAVNIMASPGAGKTSIILGILNYLPPDTAVAVIEGDIASSIDAEKIEARGIPVVQINTGGGVILMLI